MLHNQEGAPVLLAAAEDADHVGVKACAQLRFGLALETLLGLGVFIREDGF